MLQQNTSPKGGDPEDYDFYALDDQGKERCFESLARQALCEWGRDHAELQLIKQRENAVFAVIDPDGSRFALRIHRANYHSDAELESELKWMQALDSSGLRAPEVIAAKDGALFKTVAVEAIPEPRQVDLLAWVSGEAIGSIESSVDDLAAAAQNYRLVGKLVAQMHQFVAQWQLPPGFTRHAWDEEGLLGEAPFWGRFWELKSLNSSQIKVLFTARDRARADLKSYGKRMDRYGLIHADPLPENFLRGEDGEIRVIDFDDGGFGWLIFDFATALFFHLGEPCFDQLLAAMIAGYQEVRDLPPQFEEKLPLFLLLRGFSYLGWVHTRQDTDTARDMAPVLVDVVMTLANDYLATSSTLSKD